MFHGPVGEALPFFATLGFDCPVRKDPASFLQEVTTPKGAHHARLILQPMPHHAASIYSATSNHRMRTVLLLLASVSA